MNPGQKSSGDSAARAFEMALAHHRAGRLSEAIDSISRAIALRPKVAEYHAQLGEFLRLAGKLEPSLICFGRAIELKPDDPAILNNFGIALSVAGKFDEAIVQYRRAINLKGDFAAAYSNLGSALRETGRLEETVAAMRSALRLNPNVMPSYINLGMTLADMGEIDQAVATYDKCLTLDPNFPRAHWNRSLLYLLRGDFPRGWAEYEWRWKFPEAMKNRRYAQPRWDGGPLQGKSIYIYPEQGFGDMMQFLRFLPEVRARGGKIILESPRELLRLFQKLPFVERIVLAGQTPAAFDVHCPLLSLAGILGTTAESIPGKTGYLKADEQLVRKWGERFDARDDRLRVGLAWAGRPTHNSDRKRSMKLADFASLASVGGVAFYSLQKGDAAAQAALPPPDLALTDWTAELNDFADTAALIEHLDLIVSVDTAVVHLAGVMGKPVWVLLSRIPDWRWMLDREDSPWYPTVRLFRQRETGKWPEAIDRLREALSERARSRPNHSANLAGQMLDVALQHHRSGRRDEAETIYRQILSQQPDHADALHLLGVVLGEKSQPQLAIELIGRAIALRPQVPDYHANLGEFLRRAGDFERSAASFRHAIALKSDDAVFHNGLGVTLAKSRQIEPAIAAFRNAIRLKGDYSDAHSNLGSALRAAGQYQEAINAYSTAISLRPDYATAHHNLSHLYLLLGDYQRGWSEFEWRLQVPSVVAPRRFDRPSWDGGDLAGKTIFVHAEQAFGDMIQFARFIPQLASRGAEVIFESLPELARLFQGLGRIVVHGQPIPPHDVHCSLLSLGGVFGVTAQSIPAPIPYLKAEPLLAEQWGRRFDPSDTRLRVGLVWAGRALPDPNRAIELKQFAPLALAAKAAFYSLQKGEPSAEAADPPPGMQLTDWSRDLNDFADTAALIANLDLLISVDTAAAHLAGAMGKPVWLLLPFVPDWRWMLDREDSPWYPTMRLFRQPEPGKWEAAIDRLSEALSERARSGSR